jgi:type I restriction enzyme M protein
LKIRKKIPIALKHFEEFFKLLPKRADSELSWTVDLDARRKTAEQESQPYRDEAIKKKQQAAQWNDRLKELKKAKNKAAIEDAEAKIKALSKEARDAENKATEIENAVYDLKAVNPNRKSVVDTRTPEQLLDIIEQKGKEITDILALLRKCK